MMAQRIHLNGGPWHDRLIAVEDGADHFHIVEPNPEFFKAFRSQEVPPLDPDNLPVREGMYSQVGRTGTPVRGEFEWDGWTSHD
jgi:hypothetical protein